MVKPYSHQGGVVSEPDFQVPAGIVGTAEYIAPEIIEGKPYTCLVDWWAYGILVYEMLMGKSPFRGKDIKSTFELIQKSHVEFLHSHTHEEVSQKSKDLIRSLLHHNPKHRLGYAGGAAEIKDHPFFHDVKFQLLSSQTPPIVPQLSGETDYHYFANLQNDWSFDEENDPIINPDNLPESSIWKRFTMIDRSDLDPDDLHMNMIEDKKPRDKEDERKGNTKKSPKEKRSPESSNSREEKESHHIERKAKEGKESSKDSNEDKRHRHGIKEGSDDGKTGKHKKDLKQEGSSADDKHKDKNVKNKKPVERKERKDDAQYF
jgi:hypothetical protein